MLDVGWAAPHQIRNDQQPRRIDDEKGDGITGQREGDVPAVSDGIVMESAVRSRPYTVQGWRPTSAVIQPASTAMKPMGARARHVCGNTRWEDTRTWRRNTLPAKTIASMRKPIPTMIREGKEYDDHRRPIAARKMVESGNGAVRIMLEDQATRSGKFVVRRIFLVRNSEQGQGNPRARLPTTLNRSELRRLVLLRDEPRRLAEKDLQGGKDQ